MDILPKGGVENYLYLPVIGITYIYRSTVMMIMKILNPDGVERRRRHRLKRRVYQNKVSTIDIHSRNFDCVYIIIGPKLCVASRRL